MTLRYAIAVQPLQLSGFANSGSSNTISGRRYSVSLDSFDFCFERENGFSSSFPPEYRGTIQQNDGYAEAIGNVQLGSKTVFSFSMVAIFAFLSMPLLAVQNRGGGALDWCIGIGAGLGTLLFFLIAMKASVWIGSSDWSVDLNALESVLETTAPD